MPIKIPAFFPKAASDVTDAQADAPAGVQADAQADWTQNLPAAAAITLGVLIVATVAVLLGMT